MNTRPSTSSALGLPSSWTTRVYWFSTSQRPSSTWRITMCTPWRMSSGSKPTTTTGLPYVAVTNSKGRIPTTVDT